MVKISVITVCFNAVDTIEQTVRSVQAQTYDHVEYLVVDGASTDGTIDLVDRYAAVIANLVSEKDRGIFDAMNKGVAMATGDVIYFLNADDSFVDDNVLRDIAVVFDSAPSANLVFGNVLLRDGPAGVLNYPARPFIAHSITEFLHNSFCHQAVFVRRSMFGSLGPFELSYRFSADYDWIIRGFKLHGGRDFLFVDRNIAFYFARGRSQQHAQVTEREVRAMQCRHFFSAEYLWYYLRYVLIRNWKKKLLAEPA